MQQANALQYDLFGQHKSVFLRPIPRKSSIEDVCNIISNTAVVEAVQAQAEPMPTHVADIDTWHPGSSSEAIAAFWRTVSEKGVKCIKAAPMPARDDLTASPEDEEELLASSVVDEGEEDEEGGGIVGAHKKLLKISLKDLKNGHDVSDVCSWIMDGKDQARLFSFDACCRVCEIDPDSLRDNLLSAGYIPQRFLH